MFLTNRPSLINRVTPIPGISDHDTIPYIESSIIAKYQRPVRRKIFLWKKDKMEDLKPGMERFVTHFVEHHTIDTGINTLLSEFESKCAALMNEHIPSKFTSTRYSQPWVNNEIKQLSRRKKRSYKKAKKTGKQKDWRRFNDIKKEAQRLCKETYNNYVSNMLEDDNTNNPKRFWSFIKSKRAESTGVALLRKEGILCSNSNANANILNDQFTSVFLYQLLVKFQQKE